MAGRLEIADQTRETHIRFRNLDNFESYIDAFDQHYESENAILKGYTHKINSPKFKLVNRIQYGNGCDFKHEILEHRGNNCFIPAKGYCFVKYNNFITGEDYSEQYLDFHRIGKRRANNMTKART